MKIIKKFLFIVLFFIINSQVYAEIVIGGKQSNSIKKSPKITNTDFIKHQLIQNCTNNLQKINTESLVGLNCKLNGTILVQTYIVSDYAINELLNDKNSKENLSIIASNIKDKTCQKKDSFNSGIVNIIEYRYVDQSYNYLFSFQIKKTDCSRTSFPK